MLQPNLNQVPGDKTADANWKSLYRLGGTAAVMIVAVMLLDIFIAFLPGGATGPDTVTVIDWFALLQKNPFLGFRDLGLLNIVNALLGIPLFLALYHVHRRTNNAYAAFAAILFFVGVTVYLANNAVFPFFVLSAKYAAAMTNAQRAVFLAAGEAMLARGADLTPGSFMGFLLPGIAGIMMAIVMLRGRIFSGVTAMAGILGCGFLVLFTISVAFMPAIFDVAIILAIIGALLSMAWYILIARRLFQLGGGRHG